MGKINIQLPSNLASSSNNSTSLPHSQSSLNIKSELTHKNLLLRGTKLKNTAWVVGISIYTGSNTKIMQNGCRTTNKVSNI